MTDMEEEKIIIKLAVVLETCICNVSIVATWKSKKLIFLKQESSRETKDAPEAKSLVVETMEPK